MRVLHVRSTAGYGGVEAFLRHFLPGLCQREVEWGLVVLRRPGKNCSWAAGLGEHGSVWFVRDRGRFDVGVLSEIKGIVRRFRPDVFHSHDYKSNMLVWAVRRTYRVPCLATLHGYTGVTPAVSLYEWLDRLVIAPRLDEVVEVAPSRTGRRMILNGIDPDSVVGEARSLERSGGDNDFRLAYVGRVSREKGLLVLMSALGSVGRAVPWRLVVVGDGPMLEKLVNAADRVGIRDRVTFAGFRENPLPLLATADALVVPSLREGCPLVVLEAMAAGKVVIGTRVGALPLMVRDGVTGWLVDPGDPSGLAEAVKLAWRHRGEWAKMGLAARELVETVFHAKRAAAEYVSVYQSILARTRSTARAGDYLAR